LAIVIPNELVRNGSHSGNYVPVMEESKVIKRYLGCEEPQVQVPATAYVSKKSYLSYMLY